MQQIFSVELWPSQAPGPALDLRRIAVVDRVDGFRGVRSTRGEGIFALGHGALDVVHSRDLACLVARPTPTLQRSRRPWCEKSPLVNDALSPDERARTATSGGRRHHWAGPHPGSRIIVEARSPARAQQNRHLAWVYTLHNAEA